MIGKWHLGTMLVADQTPMARGFDHFLGFLDGASDYYPFSKAGLQEDYRVQRNYEILNPNDYLPNPEKVYMTNLFTDEAVEVIRGGCGRGNQPFFLYLSYNAPHTPLQAPESYKLRNIHIPEGKRRTFAGMMTAVDDGVGKVIQALKEEGLYNNTLIFFYSDNGGPTNVNTSLNVPFRGGKGDTYEGGVCVPFIVSLPSLIKFGQVRNHPIFSLDIAPTILAFTGHEIDSSLQGFNLLPWLFDENIGLHFRDFYFLRGSARGLRSGQYKITKNSGLP